LHIKHNISQEELDSIAHKAQGFVGADLLAIVNRALTEAAVNEENIIYKHLCIAVTQVKPSAIKEVLVQVPNVSFIITSQIVNILMTSIHSICLCRSSGQISVAKMT